MELNEALVILGFKEDESPTKEEVKKEYKKRALKIHPDKNKDPNATQKFQELTDALNMVLSEENLPFLTHPVINIDSLIEELKTFIENNQHYKNDSTHRNDYLTGRNLSEILQDFNDSGAKKSHWSGLLEKAHEFSLLLENNLSMFTQPDDLYAIYEILNDPNAIIFAHSPEYSEGWEKAFIPLEKAAEQKNHMALLKIAEYILGGVFYPVSKESISWALDTVKQLKQETPGNSRLTVSIDKLESMLGHQFNTSPPEDFLKTAQENRSKIKNMFPTLVIRDFSPARFSLTTVNPTTTYREEMLKSRQEVKVEKDDTNAFKSSKRFGE